MFTVLIAEKEHIDSIHQENRLFFEPFLNSKDIAFCIWNPMGQTLEEAVPGLYDAVGRHRDWRAVIINNSTAQSMKKRNPFDLADRSAIDALVRPTRQPSLTEPLGDWEREWKSYFDALLAAKEDIYRKAMENPLQKLSAWLCFRPEDYIHNDIRSKQDVDDWAMEQLGRDRLKSSTKLERLERDQYKKELRIKEIIRREFIGSDYMNIAYPSEVYCVSTRAAENNYFDPDDYWNVRLVNEYSQFADRNMFFDRMRFMVFDLLSSTHRNFRTDYIRFLATVLILVANPVPGSALQARRLYLLNADSDDSPLCTIVTSYDKKLSATFEQIENEKERILGEIPGEMTDKAVEKLFCTPEDVPVVLDESCDVDRVYAEKNYGLLRGSSENEGTQWSEDFRTSKKALAYITKQQSRSVRKGVNKIRYAGEVADLNVTRLTPRQLDDVRKFTEDEEDKMVAAIPPDFTDESIYMERMSGQAEKVKKTIATRMSPKIGLLIGLLCTVMYIICFIPFIVTNSESQSAQEMAMSLSGSAVLMVVVSLLICFIRMRLTIRKAVDGYNDTARDVMKDITSSMDKISEYLSATSNVRRGYAVQNNAKYNIDKYTRSLRIRKKHQEDIRKKRAILAEQYGEFLGDRSFCDEVMSRPYEYDFDVTTEYKYPVPFLAGDARQIEFISGGNKISVPSSYITKIYVRMEEIYEK